MIQPVLQVISSLHTHPLSRRTLIVFFRNRSARRRNHWNRTQWLAPGYFHIRCHLPGLSGAGECVWIDDHDPVPSATVCIDIDLRVDTVYVLYVVK
jgi:hypothetical protein